MDVLLAIATLIVGCWMAVSSQEPVDSTVTLLLGVVVAVLGLVELAPALRSRL